MILMVHSTMNTKQPIKVSDFLKYFLVGLGSRLHYLTKQPCSNFKKAHELSIIVAN